MTKKKQKIKKIKQPPISATPMPIDPLGMYGMAPILPALDDEPTQDADDL